MRTFILVTLLITCSVYVAAQQTSSQTRAQELAASFSKQKSVTKEKNGIKVEKYKEVRCEPLVRQNVSEYSGAYEVPDLPYSINLQVGTDGRVQARGVETSSVTNQARTFKLENAKIEGALLTGTKLYEDGTTVKFEGLFMTRTDRDSPTDVGTSQVGLGVALATPFERDNVTFQRLFYQLKP